MVAVTIDPTGVQVLDRPADRA